MLWKIVWRVLLGLLLTVYVAVALVNYSVVQSYLGAAASRHFSEQWGGEVHIGSLHAMPWDHLILRNVRLVPPDGDTILDVESLRVSFRKFPFQGDRLAVERVFLRNGYYYFRSDYDSVQEVYTTNLQYIIDHYTQGQPPKNPEGVFTVDVKSLTLSNVHYKMDLPDVRPVVYDVGVEIPHMEFYNISGRVKNIHVVNDDVTCKLLHLKTVERSGFTVDDLKGNVHVGPHDITVTDFEARMPLSTIVADVRMTYDGWEEMMDYVNTVNHEVTLHEGTSVALSDIAYWAPVLWGAETQIEAHGTANGTINRMVADLDIGWGERSQLLLTGKLKDITAIDSASVDIDIERLRTDHEDLQPLLVLLKADQHLQQVVREVEYVDLGLRLRGGLKEASTANLNLSSGLGDLRADASLRPVGDGMAFDLEAGSNSLGLRLLRSDWLSRTGFAASVTGSWADLKNPKTLRGKLQGELMNSVVRGQRIAPVSIEGELKDGNGEVEVVSTDSLAQMTLKAQLAQQDSTKHIHTRLDIGHLDAVAFKLLPEKYGDVKTHAELTLDGKDLDEMQGQLTMTHTEMGSLAVDNIDVTVSAHQRTKIIQLTSDPVEAKVSGGFRYEDLPLMVRHMGREVLPEDLFKVEPLSDEELAQIADNQIYMQLQWKDDGRFLQGVSDGLRVSAGTRIEGKYSNSELLKMVLRSDSMRFGEVVLDNIGLSSHATPTGYVVEMEAQEVNTGAMELLKRANITLNSNRHRAIADLTWGTEGAKTTGDLRLRLREGLVSVLKPDFTIGSTAWRLQTDSVRISNDGRLRVSGERIALHGDNQSLTARLSLLGEDNDCVELAFDDFSLKGVADLLLQESPVNVAGDIKGRFSLYGLNQTPYFNANLRVDSCVVNRQPLGDVKLRSNWNAELNMLNLDLAGDQIDATGWVELGKKEPEINFNVGFDHFELGLIAPLLSEFASRVEGRLHGDLDITGTTSQPLVVGEAYVEDGVLGLGITGVTYYLDDSISFANHLIKLNNFAIRDPRNNIATLDGEIRYNDLNDINLDLRVNTDNLLLLDRKQGEEFYGTLLASASGTVKGKTDSLMVYVRARTNPGSRLTVPVSDQRQVKAHNYIVFVSDQPEASEKKNVKRQDARLNLELDLAVTPDVQLTLPMDFNEVNAKVTATGMGDLHLTLTGEEEPEVLGSYEITSGTMKLGLLSLIEKNFAIESGSSLGFQGSLPSARFDLRAVYSQRVNLSTLTGSMTDVGSAQKYIQVEDVIAITGTLQEPTLGFDIRLPNADASVEEEVFAYIDRSNERDMLNQTVSLLVLGQFYNANTAALNGNIATSGGIGALSGLLTDLVGVVDINVDYKAANEVTKEQLDVNISKDWGRWYLESTLGYGGESRELETGGNSAVIDALIGYRLSPLVHLFAYNRTNTNDYTRMDLPYKQGVGLKLTKDFDRWSELFTHQKRKKKK
ncbi:MAG: translocation/assembly module TamB domain-containing protein [Bacteroidales bacterium]|nr:translocation/assembly module TamB domain-containing protein [Bacteroidales bacterium]